MLVWLERSTVYLEELCKVSTTIVTSPAAYFPIVTLVKTSDREYYRGKYHSTIDLLFD
jgi:hypothetical protein